MAHFSLLTTLIIVANLLTHITFSNDNTCYGMNLPCNVISTNVRRQENGSVLGRGLYTGLTINGAPQWGGLVLCAMCKIHLLAMCYVSFCSHCYVKLK